MKRSTRTTDRDPARFRAVDRRAKAAADHLGDLDGAAGIPDAVSPRLPTTSMVGILASGKADIHGLLADYERRKGALLGRGSSSRRRLQAAETHKMAVGEDTATIVRFAPRLASVDSPIALGSAIDNLDQKLEALAAEYRQLAFARAANVHELLSIYWVANRRARRDDPDAHQLEQMDPPDPAVLWDLERYPW